ncbi:MAG: hypothetical protein PHC88_05630 [Terrimicrobiaceae bacterium]|nr:hypothetical protein [Terrimicrobiaceae bacterium]
MATFAAVGVSTALFVKGGTQFRTVLTGTWVGTIQLQESNNGGSSYAVIDSVTANIALDYETKPYDRLLRLSCTAYTSGTATYTLTAVGRVGARTKYTAVPIGSVAYGSFGTDTTPVATVSYLVEIFVGEPFTCTGAACLNGTAAATDKYIFALYDTSGNLLATTALAGVTATGTDAFQQIAWTAPLQLPAGRYILMVTTNGTTTRLRTIATATFVNVLAGSLTAQVFATVPSTIVFPETFTADKGVISYLY